MPTRVEVRNTKAVIDNMRRIAEELHGAPMVQAMERATLVVLGDAKRFAPVDTGRLRSSLTNQVQLGGVLGRTLQGVVGTNVKYAPYMELGTGTPAGNAPVKFPPPSALEGWARRHGASAYLIARAIYRRGGLEPRRYLQRALDQNEARVVEILGKAVKAIVEA